MHSSQKMKKSVAVLVMLAFSTFSTFSTPAGAAMVKTSETFKLNQHDLSQKRIHMFLDRSDVHHHLVAWGINPDEAKARVDSLTDAEIENIASRLGHLPAGGNAVGTIVGAALIIFIVLLLTDILGFTDVFHFVRK